MKSALFKKNRKTIGFAVSFTLIPLLTSSSLATFAYYNQQQILDFDWWIWILLYAVSTFTMAFGATPTTFVATLGGFFLGWISLPPMLFAYLGASCLCFLFAKRIDGGNLLESIKSYKNVDRFLEKTHNNELALVISSKLSPILPFALSNFLLAILKIRFTNFILGCFLGMLPRTCLAIWVGTQISEINQGTWSETGWIPKISLLVLVIVASLGFVKIFRK